MYRFKPLEFKRHITKGVSYPEGRINSIISSDGNNLYMFNGSNPVSVCRHREFNHLAVSAGVVIHFQDIWAYNLSSRKWKLLINNKIPVPTSIEGRIGVMYETNFLIISTIATDSANSNVILNGRKKSSLYLCDLRKKSVTVKNTTGEIPISSSASNMIRHGKCLYIINLVGFGANNFDVYQLNTETKIWKAVYECEENHSVLSNGYYNLVYDGKSIFVFGGLAWLSNGTPFTPLTKIPVFDLQKLTWKLLDTHGDESYNFPAERMNYSICQYRDPANGDVNVIITGGIVSNRICTDIWKLNLTSLKWKFLGSMPSKTGHNYSTTITPNGQLIIFGGMIQDSNNKELCTSAVYSTFLIVPKLEDICWQAVLHYYPNLASKSKEEVLSLGISWKIFQSRFN